MRVDRSESELEELVARIDRHELDPWTGGAKRWGEARQQRLIDTILRDWCVPAVHVARSQPGAPDRVLDGGRRLHTIARFFHDELPCSGAVPPAHDDLTRLDGLRFSDLPAAVRRRVRRFRLTVVTFSDYHAAELAELLDRLDQPAAPPPPVPAPRAGGTSGGAARRSGTHRAPVSPEPIYDQVSAWFADLSEFRELSGSGGPRWASPADAGDAAARAAAQPASGGVTEAGLPQRDPRAQLVPGGIEPSRDPSTGAGPATVHDADDVGERLAKYQHGVAEGRRDRNDDPDAQDTGPIVHQVSDADGHFR